MNTTVLQHDKETGIFINVELGLGLASNIQERQRNFAESNPRSGVCNAESDFEKGCAPDQTALAVFHVPCCWLPAPPLMGLACISG